MTEFDKDMGADLLVSLEAAGQLFPGYELHKVNGRPLLLGKGGFSVIYEMREAKVTGKENQDRDCGESKQGREACAGSRDTGTPDTAGSDRAFALKVIGLERHAVSGEQFRENCRLQRLIAGQSPYVVRLLDCKGLQVVLDEENGGTLPLQMILMEKLDPILEKDRFRNTRLLRSDLEEEWGVYKFALEIGHAIRTAHANKVLHRDIKLENIFWDEAKQIYKLGDFGLARYVESGSAETIVYTDGYGAPEIERHLADAYDETADIYSFGITLYLLLNGLKFPGSDRYQASLSQYDPEFVFPAPKKASPQMTRIIRKMCSFYPEDRYQSMDEVLKELTLLLEERNLQKSGQDVNCGKETDGNGHIMEHENRAEEEDRETVTYREKSLYEAEAVKGVEEAFNGSGEVSGRENMEPNRALNLGDNASPGIQVRLHEKKKSRAERIRNEKELGSYSRWMDSKYTVLLSVLLLLILYGLQGDELFFTDWRFWSFPVALMTEAVLLKIRDFHVAFGFITLATGMYSIITFGITLPHIILLSGLLSGIPVFAMSAAVSVFGWGILKMAGEISFLDFLTGKWFVRIYLVIFLHGLYSMNSERFSIKRLTGKRGKYDDLSEAIMDVGFYALPYLLILSGIGFWGMQKAGIMEIPTVIRNINPVLTGIMLFAVQVIDRP